MVAIVGTYLNGYVKLDKEYSTKKPVKVIVTFLEEVETPTEKGFSKVKTPITIFLEQPFCHCFYMHIHA